VPSTFALLLSRTNLAEYDLSHLRYLTQAGGPMPPATTQRLLQALPHVKLFVMYGQTEATARLSYLPPDKLLEKMGSIGMAIPGVTLEVHDEQGHQCPPGVSGEICARGDNIMLGYWDAPQTTAKILRDDWLHTGDLAHKDEDGYIFIDGRSSDMIKSGANRISPKEIEEVIAELEGVEEVGVTGIPDEILGQIIKAVIVVKPNHHLDEMSVRNHCRKNLAVYKTPKIVEFATTLPKTASGKLQRFLL
jgi:long-chain acyl-CoA synthetase